MLAITMQTIAFIWGVKFAKTHKTITPISVMSQGPHVYQWILIRICMNTQWILTYTSDTNNFWHSSDIKYSYKYVLWLGLEMEYFDSEMSGDDRGFWQSKLLSLKNPPCLLTEETTMFHINRSMTSAGPLGFHIDRDMLAEGTHRVLHW